MPRRPRFDRLGLLHHIMNRGLARRTVFETREDVRVFLALLALAVHQGRIELHAYAILSTHFHLLVRSLDGHLSETMRRVENAYARWFNRKRRRDGPLFRGRFRSFPVEGQRYLRTLIRYVDQNAVNARLVAVSTEYPNGSARHHANGLPRPRWLCRSLVDQFLAPFLGSGVSRIESYQCAFPPRLTQAQRDFVERCLMRQDRSSCELEDLLAAAPDQVRSWMERKALLADGTGPGVPLASAAMLERLVAVHRRRAPNSFVDVGPRRRRSVWDLARVALLHDLAGESHAAIARRYRTSRHEISRRAEEHRTAFARDEGYRAILVELARGALEAESPRAAAEVAPDIQPPPSPDSAASA